MITFKDKTVGFANYTMKDFENDMAAFVSSEILPKIKDAALENVIRSIIFPPKVCVDWVLVRNKLIEQMPEIARRL